MEIAFGERLKVIGFLHKGPISAVTHSKMSDITDSVKVIGDDYRSIEEAIDAGEQAWLDSGKTLNYRIETMDGEEVMTRFYDLNYQLADKGQEMQYRLTGKMQTFDYIREFFE